MDWEILLAIIGVGHAVIRKNGIDGPEAEGGSIAETSAKE